MRKPNAKPMNPQLARGINEVGRSGTYVRKGLMALKKKGITPKRGPVAAKAAAAAPAKKVAGTPRYLPAEKPRTLLRSRKSHHHATKLRASITPGTILIILAGAYKGCRVVFLKQLPSGLLLVTGPYKVNGVPVRRVNQSYVIATSTKVDISKVEIPEQFTDSFFRREKKQDKKTQSEKNFFIQKAGATRKSRLSAERKQLQKTIDAAVMQSVSAVPQLSAYLSERFTLAQKKGVYPHDMKF